MDRPADDQSGEHAIDRRRVVGAGAASFLLGSCRPGRGGAQPIKGFLQLLSPKVHGVASDNLKRLGARPDPSYTYAIDDADARVPAGVIPFEARAPGMKNLEVYTHGRRIARFTPLADGQVSGRLDLSGEARGPLVVDVYAWDSPPGDNGFDVVLKMRFHLFVTDGRDASPTAERAAGHPAHGRRLLFEDTFASLSAGYVPSATEGKRWFTNKPGGGDFGDAAFERAEEGRTPFHTADGFLRIRAQHDAEYNDRYGYKRPWYSGLLATAFNDGSASFAVRRGYFEARMMIPHGAGVWPAFWLVPVRSIRDKDAQEVIEIDALEFYGFPPVYNVTAHLWNGNPKRVQSDILTPPTATNFSADQANRGDLTWDFHEFGVEVTDAEYVFYCDGRALKRMPAYKTSHPEDAFYVVVNLALGGGWPVPLPPGGRHDLWIDHVRVYAPAA